MATRSRRVKGEGSIYQRHDHPNCPPEVDGERPDHSCRGTWVGQLNLGHVGGKRLRPTVTARTRTELSKKLAERRRQVDRGVFVDGGTVEAWLNHWLDAIAPKRVRERTLDGYRSYVRTWLIPYLGRHRLDRLTPDHVRAMYEAMEEQGKSDATRRQAHMILRRAMVVAEREGKIMRNPAALVDPPPVGKNHHTPLTLEQARRVIAALSDEPPAMAARWLCALLQGMRQGECLGLRWEDVDIENRRIWIRQELYRVKARGLVEADPKSRESMRSIPMLDPVAFLLEATPHAGEYVFYGKATDNKKDWTAWKALLVKAGVCPADMVLGEMPALHAARGTTASLLDAAGVSDKVTSEILGHASVQITRTAYIHGNEARHRQAMDALQAFVEPPKE